MSTSRTRALWLTARPKTLSAAIVPVVVAHAFVWSEGFHPQIWISVCAVLAAMMIQVGTNFVNDAIDFLKGADKETRLGEARASQQGWFTHKGVLRMGFACFALAAVFGAPLVWQGGWPILLVGVVSLVMGYAYTGGPFPLAYLGLGDLFVILFFGVVAVTGAVYLHIGQVPMGALVAGLQVGLLATVMIAINNLRDLDQDRLVNKKTLAVRLGPRLGRYEVFILIAGAFLLGFYWLAHNENMAFLLPLIALPLGLHLSWTLIHTEASTEYNRLLARGSLVHMLFGMMLSVGFFFV